MAYLVKLMPRARRDLKWLFEHIRAADTVGAFRWYEGLKRAIFGLENPPNRFAVMPENKRLRHFFYGHKPHIYRVIYRVTERKKQVGVLHIRHGGRRRFTI